jgi:hypothetical protein
MFLFTNVDIIYNIVIAIRICYVLLAAFFRQCSTVDCYPVTQYEMLAFLEESHPPIQTGLNAYFIAAFM